MAIEEVNHIMRMLQDLGVNVTAFVELRLPLSQFNICRPTYYYIHNVLL